MIQLIEGFAMTADEHCYTVGRLRKSRGKGSELRDPKYYTNVIQAVSTTLDRAMRLAVKDERVTTLREFINEQERLKAELQKLLAPLEGGESLGKLGEGHRGSHAV